MPLTKSFTFLAAAIVLAFPARAAAECSRRPRVQVHVEGSKPALAQRTLALVTAELTARRGACENVEDEAPARIVLRWLDDAHVRIEAELRGIRAEREVNYAGIPADGVPAALAIATDELLRSLYEEEQSTAAGGDEPAELPAVLESEGGGVPHEAERPLRSFGLGVAFEAFPTTRSLAGPEARLSLPLQPRFSLDLHVGSFALVSPFEASARDRHHGLVQLGVHARHEIAKLTAALTVSGIAGVDALVLLDASPVARPALRIGVRASLPAGPRMRFDAGLDAVWLPFALDVANAEKSVLSGVGIGPSVAWVATF